MSFIDGMGPIALPPAAESMPMGADQKRNCLLIVAAIIAAFLIFRE